MSLHFRGYKMGKDQDLLQAVRDQDLVSLHKLLNRTKANKSKIIGSTKRLNVNFQDQDGMAALHQAALVGNTEIMRVLLDCAAATDLKDTKGMRPLHYAAWQGNKVPVSILLHSGSSANQAAGDGMTPLHLACEHGHFDVVSLLLQYKGDPAVDNKAHKTPLDLAAEFGRYRVVELLIESGQCNALLTDSQDDMADNNRTTCLHLAAKNGHADIIRLLLQSGMDINRQTLQGTCLHEAALYGKIEVVKLLLDCGIEVNKPNSFDQTALDIVNKFTTSRAAKELKQLLKDASYVVQAQATRSYSPSTEDLNHIGFSEGDLLTVLEQHPSGMWKGFVTQQGQQMTKTGYFPSSSVMLIPSPTPPKPVVTQTSNHKLSVLPVPDLLTNRQQPQHSPRGTSPCPQPPTNPPSPAPRPYATVGVDSTFPPPPSPLVSPKHSTSSRDSDRDSGISPQQHYPSQPFPQTPYGRQPSPNSPAERTAEWLGRYVVDGADPGPHSPGQHSPTSSAHRLSTGSNGSNGGYLPNHYVNGGGGQQQQHRLSGQSYESGVSGVTASSRQSYHSASSSSLGSLDRLEESGYSSTVNVHELFQAGLLDGEVLRAWLADLHFEEYYHLFVAAGYDMPTISRMTPEDLTAIGITKPAHRKRLKAEISKLHIHDGIPDYKPADLSEWLGLLGLDEYHNCLGNQGYVQLDDITDIMWEDLEEIGIKKLGHQKKMMLAIDRLRRIQSGSKRLSSLERKAPPHEGLEPASSYPTPNWLSNESKHTQSAATGPPPSYDTIEPRSPRRSASGENLHLMMLSPHELRSFREEGWTGSTDLIHSMRQKSLSYHPDVVAIQVNRAASFRSGETSNYDNIDQLSVNCMSFQSPGKTNSPKVKEVDGDATPTNERRNIPQADDGDTPTLRRPSAKVSPRISPKPKPIAKIVAKSKHTSREMGGMDSPKETLGSGSLAYSCSTLPRRSASSASPSKNKYLHTEHIYDHPATDGKGEVSSFSSSSPAPSSPAHSTSQCTSPWVKKKAPPPPPKRTNSIKCDMRTSRTPSSSSSAGGDGDVPDSPATPSKIGLSDPGTYPPGPQQKQQGFTSCVQSLSSRFAQKDSPSHQAHPPKSHRPSQGGESNYPPHPASILSRQSSSSSSSNPQYDLDVSSETDNPLNDVIQQLEKEASHKLTSDSAAHTSRSDSSAQQQQNRSQSEAHSVETYEETGIERRRNGSPSSIDSSSSGCSTDSNTLPFANENVGTIKQRNPAAKASIVTVSGDSEDDDERNVELDGSLFEEETGTMKRNPKAAHKEVLKKPQPPPSVPKATTISNLSQQPNNTGDVLNDIDNMLQDLTDELDAMLETELQLQ